jgi:hypothetical protein
MGYHGPASSKEGSPPSSLYPCRFERAERKTLNPNVKFVQKSNSSEKGQSHSKKKFSLADMTKNAKKVEREVARPIVEALVNDGHIPNPFLEQIEESVIAKVTAFSRKLDHPFTREFGRLYSNERQKAWKRAKDKERRNPFGNLFTHIRGVNFSTPEDAVLRIEMKNQTYIRQGPFRVKLPSPVMNWYNTNAYEASLIMSGKATGIVSTSVEYLKYETTFEGEEIREYISELDELTYIYKAYWYLTNINKKNWIRDLYTDPDKKIIDYRFSKVPCPDGIHRADNVVLFVIEGTDFYVHVEDVYRWICHYRTPRKKYAIGESDSEMAVHYAIYLEQMYGIPESIIRERLTVDLVEQVRGHMEVLHLATDPLSKDTEWDEDLEAIRRLGIDPTFDYKRAEDNAVQAQEILYKMVPVNFSDGKIDLTQLDDGETDSNITLEEIEERNNDIREEYNLPYEYGINENEFFSADYSQVTIEKEITSEDFDDNRSVNSENIPDKELNPLDELGVDLVDPSRDTTDQPELRRIGLTWDPGGGNRSLIRRFIRQRINRD